jgi:hypothetical protein
VFERSLNKCYFNVGDKVKIRGTPKRGEIIDIATKAEHVEWVNNRPHYICVIIKDDMILCNPGQLKRINK